MWCCACVCGREAGLVGLGALALFVRVGACDDQSVSSLPANPTPFLPVPSLCSPSLPTHLTASALHPADEVRGEILQGAVDRERAGDPAAFRAFPRSA